MQLKGDSNQSGANQTGGSPYAHDGAGLNLNEDPGYVRGYNPQTAQSGRTSVRPGYNPSIAQNNNQPAAQPTVSNSIYNMGSSQNSNPAGGNSFNQGANSGGNMGVSSGYNAGMNAGMNQGYNSGMNPGINSGINDGSGSIYSSGPSTIKKSGGINPLFIIIPVLVILIIIGVSQYKKIFGKAEYIPGLTSDHTYTNEYFGIKIDLSDNYGISKSVADSEAVKKTLDTKETVQEFYAQNNKTAEAIGIFVQQLPYNVKESGTDMSSLMDQLESEFKTELAAQGVSNATVSQEKMTVAGKTCNGIIATGKINGISVSMAQFYVFKGNYVCGITSASTSEGKARQIITNNVSGYVATE